MQPHALALSATALTGLALATCGSGAAKGTNGTGGAHTADDLTK